MKRIIIIGSKPRAIIPEGDVIYCANGAIGYYEQSVRRFESAICILNPDLIHPKKRKEGSPTKDFYDRQYSAIAGSKPDKLILLRNTSQALLTEELRYSRFTAPIHSLSSFERRILVGKITGLYDPIVTVDFFQLQTSLQIRYTGSLTSTFLKRIINRKKDCGAYFRPSTGVIALIYAINEHGDNAEYVIAGIGLKNRTLYYDGINPSQNDLPHHVFADKKVLQRLAKRYRLFTTEQELMPYISPWNQQY